MYSMILFIVDLSFIALGRSGFTQTSAVESIVNSVGIINTAGECHQFVQLKGRGKFLDLLQFRPTPDNDELDIIAVSFPADVVD